MVGPAAVIRRRRAVAGWDLWTLPAAAVGFVLLIDAGAMVLFTVAGVTSGFGGGRDVVTFALLSAGSIVGAEAIRHIGEPSGNYQDLMTVWTLPIALLLPTPYALLASIPNDAWTQWRVRKAPLHRRFFSAASIGLTHAGAGALFRLLATGHPVGGAWSSRPALVIVVALVAGLLGEGTNTALVGMALRLSAPGFRWRGYWPGLDVAMLAGVEVCTGVAVTVLAVQAPVFVLLALPATTLLHRSLLHSQLQVAARTDPKTGLLNAAAWQQQVDREIDRCRRDGRTLAVLVLDVDHFKAVNDRHGHLAGDQVLAELAEVLRRELRPSDTIGRFGGEEFVVAIPAGPSRAMAIAGRLCQRIAGHVAEVAGQDVRITASIGVAMFGSDGYDATELLAAADRALYAAKAAGRNRVAAAGDPDGSAAS